MEGKHAPCDGRVVCWLSYVTVHAPYCQLHVVNLSQMTFECPATNIIIIQACRMFCVKSMDITSSIICYKVVGKACVNFLSRSDFAEYK